MKIELDDKEYEVIIIKKNNRNTYIRIKDGKIVVTTNYLTTKNSIMKLINDNKSDILKMIDRDNKRKDKDNEFYYFGKLYDIIYGFNEIEFMDNKIYVKDEKTLYKYINNEIIKIYQDRLNYYYHLFEEDIPIPNLKIRKMTSRWGVCNIKNHNVTLNYNLSKYDICCLDYVIVHELSHFIHPNHSKDFWSLVEKYYPNYKKCRKMLKD
ncbi:MAG: M48 family metallopeptidase [Bacilli bacterium]|nr:M48 family metallopeptidase [Bacilli bacterium]